MIDRQSNDLLHIMPSAIDHAAAAAAAIAGVKG